MQLVGLGSAYKMPFVPNMDSIPTAIDPASGQRLQAIPSLAAGLPHFSAGIFRSWGRGEYVFCVEMNYKLFVGQNYVSK